MTSEMADIMGTSGLAWHQWRKHGTCTDLSATAYFELSRKAFDVVSRPEILRRLKGTVRISPQVVEDVFLQENPQLTTDGITITCRSDHIQEARICLTRDLEPRRCGEDVIRDCAQKNALFTPVR